MVQEDQVKSLVAGGDRRGGRSVHEIAAVADAGESGDLAPDAHRRLVHVDRDEPAAAAEVAGHEHGRVPDEGPEFEDPRRGSDPAHQAFEERALLVADVHEEALLDGEAVERR